MSQMILEYDEFCMFLLKLNILKSHVTSVSLNLNIYIRFFCEIFLSADLLLYRLGIFDKHYMCKMLYEAFRQGR
jgi:hypothetical protein